MGNHQTPLLVPFPKEGDGLKTVTEWVSSRAPNQRMRTLVDALVDAHVDAPNADEVPVDQWMPGLGMESEEATAPAAPSGHLFLAEPSTSQSDFDLPFFISNYSAADLDRPSCLFIDRTRRQSPSQSIAPHADCLPLFYTFYLSPSASRSSVASSLWPSSLSRSGSVETQLAMRASTLDVPAEQFLAPPATDYFATSANAPSEVTSSTTPQLRPYTAGSGRSGRTLSPLIFTRWSRRHPQEHGQEPPRLKGSGRGVAGSKAGSKSNAKRTGRSRSSSIQKRQPQAGAVPQMTREEFEALPLAIQRKYFSTLERLRFAQESGLVDGISRHYDDISNSRRRKPQPGPRGSEHPCCQTHRGSALESCFSTSDSSPLCLGLSNTAETAELSREKQVSLARRLRASVILDAADEAVYKLRQQANRRDASTALDTLTPPLSPRRNSMDSLEGIRRQINQPLGGPGRVQVPQSFYDSFRWLDEEEDLDLRLFLDDYHANLREDVPTAKQQRPSFRRHLSISKLPFGRASVSLSRPGTKDATSPTSPIHSPSGSISNSVGHSRRKSRALSLVTPRHAPQPSITAFDPAAAHYQDPEARLKLRVYLASPQKFDEAVEFGFPLADVVSPISPPGVDSLGCFRRQSNQKLADGSSNMRTFLADEDDEDNEKLSLNSDQASLADPDSPKTPEPFESKVGGPRHARLASAEPFFDRDFGGKGTEGPGYVQAPATSREMTLRMTLTRPDLRAHEEEIYGWQQKHVYQHHSRRPSVLAPLSPEASGAYLADGPHKESMEKFPAMDHWNASTTDKGVMKRIWKRVRRG